MSSNEEDYEGDNQQGSKKRRIQRACDICRRKKIRCDGVQMPGNRCSNCIAYSFDCTYMEAAKKRGPPKGYVESLENRLEKLERLLRKICPDDDFLKDLNANLDNDKWLQEKLPNILSKDDPSMCSPNHHNHTHPGPSNPRDIATSVIRRVGSPVPSPDSLHDDDFAHILLADNLKRLSLDPKLELDVRFFGKSSGAMLVQTAIELKNEYTGTNQPDLRRQMFGSKRPEFWDTRSWEQKSNHVDRASYVFPEEDLMTSLVELYFKHFNLYIPLLHRPTFEKSLAEGLHQTNDMFGATVLLVCAVGSRYSDDPRILLEGVDTFHSCGWKWFDQVQMIKKSLLTAPTLYDLQYYCLAVMFLQGSSAPQSCWTMVGIGIRLAQDVGAHRRKYDRNNMTMEDEMWKRAFWVLVAMDRMVSSALGRPCAIQDEDFDVDFPVECDDEYWDHEDPAQRFKQPPNKPCLVTSFVLYLKLNQVIAFSLRTIYSINKSKILLGFVGQQWEQHIVSELDSALNKWVDSVPDYLRWDPNREDDRFFNQSATLFCTYYHIQILIHRPFIPSPRKPSPLSFPSLAICTNAARSCSHIIDIQRQRDVPAPPQIQMAVFTAGIVLLLNIWGGKRSGITTDPSKEMADVYKCMQVLRAAESRWHSAGRLWDILYELATVGDLPLPKSSPPASNKRERNADSPASTIPTNSNSPGSSTGDVPRTIAGSRRVTRDGVNHPMTSSQSQHHPSPQTQPPPIPLKHQSLFTLPVYSDELGRLPLHDQGGFLPPPQAPMDPAQMAQWFAPNLTPSMPSTSSTGPPAQASYPPPDINMPSSFSMDSFLYEQMGMSYASPFAQTTSSGSSQSTSQSAFAGNPGGPIFSPMGAEINPQQMGMMPGRFPSASMNANAQALIDSDTIAMWSNAPTGFELDDWGTYLSNVSELTQGFHHSPGQGPPGDQRQ